MAKKAIPLFTYFNFSEALAFLKVGMAVRRAGWNGKTQYVKMQVPDKNSKNTLPYLYIITEQRRRVPFVVSQSDLFASDWQAFLIVK